VCVSVRVRDLARLSQSEFRILAFRHEVRRWVLASVPRVKKRSETFKPREAPESVSVCECVRSKKKTILIGLITNKLLTLPLCVSDKKFNFLESQK